MITRIKVYKLKCALCGKRTEDVCTEEVTGQAALEAMLKHVVDEHGLPEQDVQRAKPQIHQGIGCTRKRGEGPINIDYHSWELPDGKMFLMADFDGWVEQPQR